MMKKKATTKSATKTPKKATPKKATSTVKKAVNVPVVDADTRLRWRKLHAGTMYHSDGQVVKQGEILKAHPHELSEIVKRGFECLDNVDVASGDFGAQLLIKKVSKGKYNVINPITNQPINDTPISKSAAEAFGPIESEITEEEDE